MTKLDMRLLFLCTLLALLGPLSGGRPASSAARLRCVLESSGAVCVPGVHDALSASIFAEAGARCLFLSGFGVSSSRLGVPDAGILTYTEMEDAARACVSAARGVPVIVDGDTGYGGAANVRRTVAGCDRDLPGLRRVPAEAHVGAEPARVSDRCPREVIVQCELPADG